MLASFKPPMLQEIWLKKEYSGLGFKIKPDKYGLFLYGVLLQISTYIKTEIIDAGSGTCSEMVEMLVGVQMHPLVCMAFRP